MSSLIIEKPLTFIQHIFIENDGTKLQSDKPLKGMFVKTQTSSEKAKRVFIVPPGMMRTKSWTRSYTPFNVHYHLPACQSVVISPYYHLIHASREYRDYNNE